MGKNDAPAVSFQGGYGCFFKVAAESLFEKDTSVCEGNEAGGRIGFRLDVGEDKWRQEFSFGFRSFWMDRPNLDPKALLKRFGVDVEKEVNIDQMLDIDSLPPEIAGAIRDSATPVTLEDLLLEPDGVNASATDIYYMAELMWRIYMGGVNFGNWGSLQPKVGAGFLLGAHVEKFYLEGEEVDSNRKFAIAMMLEGGTILSFHTSKGTSIGIDIAGIVTIGKPTILNGRADAFFAYHF